MIKEEKNSKPGKFIMQAKEVKQCHAPKEPEETLRNPGSESSNATASMLSQKAHQQITISTINIINTINTINTTNTINTINTQSSSAAASRRTLARPKKCCKTW